MTATGLSRTEITNPPQNDTPLQRQYFVWDLELEREQELEWGQEQE